MGQDYSGKGLYPEWSADNPIHLVGHSAGGNTIRLAQYLLSIDHYGIGSNEDWVRSITGLSAVFNGSTLTYMLGCDQETGLVAGLQGKALFKFVQLFASITGANTDDIYDFDLNQWGYDREDGETLESFLAKISDSRFMDDEDNLAFDLSVQGCARLNEYVPTYPNTHYFSHVTEQTSKYWFSDCHRPEVMINPALATGAFFMGQFEFNQPPIDGWGTGLMRDELWYQNDGCVPAMSQRYPFTAGYHPAEAHRADLEGNSFEPGKWHWDYAWGGSCDHCDIIFLYISEFWKTGAHKQFYINLYKRLASLEEKPLHVFADQAPLAGT